METYRFDGQGSLQLEKRLIEAFPEPECAELGLAPFLPRMYRGLPRVYRRENPSQGSLKKHFNDLPSLKVLAAEKALCSLYWDAAPQPQDAVALFVWVIGDGLGDYAAALESLRLLQGQFPSLDVRLYACLPERFRHRPLDRPDTASFFYYEGTDGLPFFPEESLYALQKASLILSLPTHYPHFERLAALNPRILEIGEYGYLESDWFHPRSGNRSLGLHFLEKGILVRNPSPASFLDLENRQLLEWLFGTPVPSPSDIERYLAANRFYLGYLTTPVGGAVYLHALLKALERDEKSIDLCTPDLDWWIRYAEERNRAGKPFFEPGFDAPSVEVWFGGQIHRQVRRHPGGSKRLRVFCPDALSPSDFRTLLSLSGDWVGVRGDQSFSEAVSANKTFFYDGRQHARYFLKDLIALAENRIPAHRGALRLFRGMGRTFLHNLPPPDGNWVDETFFQEKEPWPQLALELALSLQDPDTLAGCKKLNRIIAQEHSCNEFLCHLVQRALFLQKHPSFAAFESQQLALFAHGSQSFAELARKIRGMLNRIADF